MRACGSCGEENPDRARFCLRCGHPLEDPPAGPEIRRLVSLIFCDLAGSTSLGETLDAEALRYLTGRYFEAMRTAVERHGGAVEKFIGDAVVGVFGVPRVREDDAVRAIRAAVEMQQALDTLNDELRRQLGISLELRIGVNSGEVVVGTLRAGGSVASGDAVNVAARLEQAAAPGQILVGESTYRLVRGQADLEAVAPLALKGKSREVPAWRVRGLVTAAAPPRAGVRTEAFVGRDAPLRLLDDAFRRAVDERACQLVTVLGLAGIGKTRLAEEWATGQRDALVLQGRCLSYGQGATYWPLRQAVLAAAGLAGDESASDAQAALKRVFTSARNRDEVVTRLLSIAGFHPEVSVPEDVPWAVRMFLEQLALSQPVVLVVDDLHWAEPGLLDVLDHVADWSRDAPIMLVGLARPELYETRPTWGGGKLNAATTLLSALDEMAAAALLDKHDLPAEVKRRIIDSASGNPLFAEQLMAMLVDEGHAVIDQGVLTWVGAPGGVLDLRLPPSIGVLLTARIDRLDDDERTVLGCAAVVGTVFYVEAVAAVTGLAAPRVADLLGRLMRKELLRPAASDLPGLTAYRFLHVLLRDASYDGLTKSTRARWHEGTAQWLDQLPYDAVPDELIGIHLADACRYRRQLSPPDEHSRTLARHAARRLAAAGRRLELSDVAAAAALLQRAVDSCDADDPDRGQYLLWLAEQCLELGEIDRARRALHAVEQGATARDTTLARVLASRAANLQRSTQTVDDTERTVTAAIADFAVHGDDAALARAYLVLAEAASSRLADARSAELVGLASEHAKAAGDAGCVARGRTFLSISYLFGPMPAEKVITALDQLVADSDNAPRVRAEAEQAACVMHAMCGRFDVARAVAAAARNDLAAVGHRLLLANLAQSTGYVEELAGDLDAAEREYDRSTRELLSMGESAYLSTVAGLHARLLASRRKFRDAETALALAREHGATDDLLTQSLITQTEALLAAGRGDLERARTVLADDEFRRDGSQVPDMVAQLHEASALAHRWLGDDAGERHDLEEARRLALVKGNIVRANRVAARIAEMPPASST